LASFLPVDVVPVLPSRNLPDSRAWQLAMDSQPALEAASFLWHSEWHRGGWLSQPRGVSQVLTDV